MEENNGNKLNKMIRIVEKTGNPRQSQDMPSTPMPIQNIALMRCADNLALPFNYTSEQVYALTKQAVSAELNQRTSIAKINAEYDRKLDYLKAETASKEYLMNRKEEMKMQREMITYGISENCEGFLCKEQFSAEGKLVGYKKICNKKHLRMEQFFTMEEEEIIYYICWEDCLKGQGIYLRREKLTPDELALVLTKAGISIQTSRDYKRNLLELVIVYLLQHSKNIELPKTFGWNKMSEGWQWISDGTITMEEVGKYAI